jgi:hypothetical protein
MTRDRIVLLDALRGRWRPDRAPDYSVPAKRGACR